MLSSFAARLQYYKTNNPKKDSRHSYCTLVFMQGTSAHFFDVRDVIIYPNNMINISSINFSYAAGSCTLTFTKDSDLDNWKILEDEPVLKVLYGKR